MVRELNDMFGLAYMCSDGDAKEQTTRCINGANYSWERSVRNCGVGARDKRGRVTIGTLIINALRLMIYEITRMCIIIVVQNRVDATPRPQAQSKRGIAALKITRRSPTDMPWAVAGGDDQDKMW